MEPTAALIVGPAHIPAQLLLHALTWVTAQQPTLAPLQYACIPHPNALATILSASASEKSRSSKSLRQATHCCCCCGSDSTAAAFSQLVKASVLVLADTSAATATHGRRCTRVWAQGLLLPRFVAVHGRGPACCASCMVPVACSLQLLMQSLCDGEALVPVAQPRRSLGLEVFPSAHTRPWLSHPLSHAHNTCSCAITFANLLHMLSAQQWCLLVWHCKHKQAAIVPAQSEFSSYLPNSLFICLTYLQLTEATEARPTRSISVVLQRAKANCAQQCTYRLADYNPTLLRLPAAAQHVHCSSTAPGAQCRGHGSCHACGLLAQVRPCRAST
jgi:hypothetical protein